MPKLQIEITQNTLQIEKEIYTLNIYPFDVGVGAIQESIGTTKGDLAVFNGTDWIRLGAGDDGQALVADSGEAGGLGWGAAGAYSTLTNKDSVEMNANDVVIHDFTNDEAFEGTTTEGHASVAGVLGETISVAHEGAVYTYAGTVVTVNCDTGAVAKGEFLITSTTKGRATVGTGAGIFAVALEAKASGSVGTVKAMILSNIGAEKKQSRIQMVLLDKDTALEVTDYVAGLSFIVPEFMDGWNLISAHAATPGTASTSGTPTIQVHNVTQAADMLSTRITIDATEKTSYTAAAQPVVDTANDDVATGDIIRVDCDVLGTGTEGLNIILVFEEV